MTCSPYWNSQFQYGIQVPYTYRYLSLQVGIPQRCLERFENTQLYLWNTVSILVNFLLNTIGYRVGMNIHCLATLFFKKMGHSRPLFLYFRLFNTVDSKQMFDKSLPMSGFELRIFGVGGDRSANWATTTAPFGSGLNEQNLTLELSTLKQSAKSRSWLVWHFHWEEKNKWNSSATLSSSAKVPTRNQQSFT